MIELSQVSKVELIKELEERVRVQEIEKEDLREEIKVLEESNKAQVNIVKDLEDRLKTFEHRTVFSRTLDRDGFNAIRKKKNINNNFMSNNVRVQESDYASSRYLYF